MLHFGFPKMGPTELGNGYLFAGRYRVLSRLATGGMGAVYEVQHVETRRRRALKVILPELLTKPELRERFQREACITADVQSEFLVDVFDAGVDTETGLPFLVMELLRGEDLGQHVERTGPLSPQEVVMLLGQLATALEKTHAAAIVHRDLKPGNLFLTRREDGTPCVKVLDFGISKVVNEATSGANMTRSLGTPLYMAPEQVTGARVSQLTDLYSLALVAYTLLVGTPYWQDEADSMPTVIAFALQVSEGPKESAAARAARRGKYLPAAFDAWFFQATSVDPNKRFSSARAMIVALSQALTEWLATVPVPSAQPAHSIPSSFVNSGANNSTPLDASFTPHGGIPKKRSALPIVGGVVVALGLIGMVAYLQLKPDMMQTAQSTSAEPVRSAEIPTSTAPPAPSTMAEAAEQLPTAAIQPAPSSLASASSTPTTAKVVAAPGAGKAPSAPVNKAKSAAAPASSPAAPPVAPAVAPKASAVEAPKKYTRD